MTTVVQLTGEAIAAWRSVLARTGGSQAAYRREMARHERRLGRLRTRVFASAVALVATGVAAAPGGGSRWWLCATALAIWFGTTGWLRLRRSVPPVPTAWAGLPTVRRWPAPPRGTPGDDVGQRIALVQSQLARVVPAVRRLYPPAGAELAGAVREAAPLLDAQLERLVVLDALARDMAGTPTAEAASRAAAQVAERVAAGVTAYERLLGAAAELLGAPDLHRTAGQVLAPAVQAMQAYSHGLAAASDSTRV
jgi:hypothetical protein